MARKFLYVMAVLIVLFLAVRLALQFGPEKASQIAFVPTEKFAPQPKLAPNIYDDPALWISHPRRLQGDPVRWMPDGFPGEDAPMLQVAVFFVHPTSYLMKQHWNAPLDDTASQQTAEIFVRGNASPFNFAPEIWAPRYRQATIGAFLSDAPDAVQALDTAYGDVLLAFDSFIAQTDPRRAIILAGHSQGSYHLKRLLMDRVAGKPMAKRIAAAYLIGWPVSLDHDLPAMGLTACAAPDQTGCVFSFLSVAEPADTAMLVSAYARRNALDGQSPGGSPFLCSNPLTGGIGGSAPASANQGTLKPDATMKTAKLIPAAVPASCRADNFLSIGDPPDLGPYALPGNNYHIYDVPLFWANLREDAKRRAGAWKP